jgi:hypothetical protein
MCAVKASGTFTPLSLTRSGRSYHPQKGPTLVDVQANHKLDALKIMHSQLHLQQAKVNKIQGEIASAQSIIDNNDAFMRLSKSIPSIRRMYQLELTCREDHQQKLKLYQAGLAQKLTAVTEILERLEKQISALTQ